MSCPLGFVIEPQTLKSLTAVLAPKALDPKPKAPKARSERATTLKKKY